MSTHTGALLAWWNQSKTVVLEVEHGYSTRTVDHRGHVTNLKSARVRRRLWEIARLRVGGTVVARWRPEKRDEFNGAMSVLRVRLERSPRLRATVALALSGGA